VNLPLDQIQAIRHDAELLHSADQVEQAISRLAEEIRADYTGRIPVLLGVMTGAVPFMGRLMLQLSIPLQMDYVHLTRYHNQTKGGELEWLAQPRTDLSGRDVLIVDDIFDEGHTLVEIENFCREQHAASVEVAVLIDKPNPRRVAGADAKYIGLQVPDVYVFGYGMDCQSYWRNLAGIYGLSEM